MSAKPKKWKGPKSPPVPDEHLSLYCDFTCRYAEFPEPDAVGACCREVGVWCSKLTRYNNKNARCLAR